MHKQLEAQTISDFLSHHFSQKKNRNDAYSMRAFARDLGLSPSRLSEIMKGKDGLSEKSGLLIAEKLRLKSHTKDYWIDLILAERGRSELVREAARKRLQEHRQRQGQRILKDEQFQVIADWFHCAVLELISLQDFDPDPKAIAARLDITVDQASAALDRLERLQFIRRDATGKWLATPELATTMDDFPSAAVRKFHRQIVEKALLSVVEDSVEERELNSIVLAVPRDKIPEFKKSIQKFFGEFIQNVGDEPKDDLYALSVQFFPIKKRGRK